LYTVCHGAFTLAIWDVSNASVNAA